MVLLAALLGLMLATVLDYGMTADEPVQNRYGRRLVRWYASLGADRAAVEQHDTFYYGGLFELAAQGARQISPLGVYETRHVVNVLFAFGGFAAVLVVGARLGGPVAGLLSVLFLALTPFYYGHAFNNPKDIPFAALFAVGTAAIVEAAHRLPRLPSRWIVGVGVAVGLAAAVRVAGLVLVPAAAVLWMAALWVRHDRLSRQHVAHACLAVLGVAGAAWIVMVAFWPWAQIDPFRNPFRAFSVFSRFWTGMPVLYEGLIVPSGRLPRTYIPQWFALTLPVSYALATILGAVALLTLKRESLGDPARRFRLVCIAWLAVTVVAPVLWVVINHTPFYNGHRHFLFVVPGLAALAGIGAAAGFRRSPRPLRLVGAWALAGSMVVTAVDMVRLHPYQSVFFNRFFAGGVEKAARSYETDYWCSTYREGIDWIVDRYGDTEGKGRIRVAGHATLTQVSYDLRRTDERRRRFRPVTVHDDPHFILATTATGDHLKTPGKVVHVVERMGAPLLFVFEVKEPR